jgi:CubicO group peptidase (beta-lactamase class C family)
MNATRTSHRTRVAALAASALVLASAVTACGRNENRAGSNTGSTTAPTTSTPGNPGNPGGSSPSSTSTTTAGGSSTSSGTAKESAYPSVITNEVVDNPKLDEFEAATKGRMVKAGLPGASLLVMQHGKVVEQEAWMGYTLDTQVTIASASKWLSAATIMTLVDEGKIDLDKPVSTYLDYAKGDVGTITTRQLLSLTSGLPDDENVPCYSDPNVTLDACNREFAAMPLLHKPGEAFRYGGQHLHFAASVAEAVSGKSWNDLFAERITGPLGMTNTRFLDSGFNPTGNQHPSPAGSGVSTLGDYGRFLEMIAHDGVAPDGTRILKSETVAEMQSNQIEGARYAKAASFRMAEKNPYGLGEWLDWVGPDGESIVVSSDGAFGFRPWIDKQNDIVGVYMINDHGGGYVDGDPRAAANDGGKVHTSGNWVFVDVAEALGGSLPKNKTP